MDNIIGLAIPLFVLIFLGFLVGKIVPDDRRELVWLNVLVVYFALPALIFTVVATAPLDRLTALTFVLATSLATYVTFLMMFIVAVTVGRIAIGAAALQASAASHGNAGYLGVPLAAVLFGPEGVLPAALILCFDSLLQATLVAALQRSERPRAARRAVAGAVKALALDPMLIAVIAGLAVAAAEIEMPLAVGRTLDLLAGAAAPAALFAVGVTIARQRLGHVRWEVPVITILKLAVHPFVALSVVLLMGGFDPLWIYVAVLVAALPTATGVFDMAARFDTYAEGVSNSVLVTTLVSLATLSLIIVVIAEDGIPLSAAALFS